MSTLTCPLHAGLGFIAVAACLGAAPVAAQDRIIAPDSSATIVLPRSWQPLDLNPNAEMQFGDSASDSYVMLLLESKEDMVGWNLTRHSMVTLAQMLVNRDMPEVAGPVATTIGGHPAVQYEVRGNSQGMRIAYLHTSIESPATFAQVVAWTVSSRWKANEKVIRDAVSSIELPAAMGTLEPDVFAIVPGTWAWESDAEPCRGLTQRFEIARDRRTMKIHHSEPIESTTGEKTSVTDYVIEDSAPLVLHTFIPGESRLTDSGDPAKWDLVAIGRNRIAWHRADWPDGALTGMLRRCDPR